MNWDYILIATAIAASLLYLVWQRALRKRVRRACGSSSAECACCSNVSTKHQGLHQPVAIPLRQLGLGCKARIVSICANGELGRRIRDMGLVPGEEVQITGRAPLQDPVSLRLRGFTLSLRNNEADQITVEPC
jgi:ferrous iron transport protein A